MKVQQIVPGITSNSFWFIGVYLVVLVFFMYGMFRYSAQKRTLSALIFTMLSVVTYLLGSILSGLIVGVHYAYSNTVLLAILLSAVPGMVGLVVGIIGFLELTFTSKADLMLLPVRELEASERVISETFSNNNIYGFSQMTLLVGLIFSSLSLGMLMSQISILDNFSLLVFILMFYLLIKIPKWFEKSVWTYAIQQQLVQDYPVRLRRRRDRNK